MNADDLQELNELLEQIRSMKVHAPSRLGAALKKPLLLLLLVSRIENNRVEENRFQFDDIEKKLDLLIREHGGRPTHSGSKPEQPFYHLRSSPFWILKTQQDYAPGKTALISDLRRPDSYGAFQPKVFRLLRSSGDARARVVDSILNEWWPETLHGDIREDLGLDRLDSRRRAQRDQQFTIDVLENFRYSCAFCGFQAVLNRVATGISTSPRPPGEGPGVRDRSAAPMTWKTASRSASCITGRSTRGFSASTIKSVSASPTCSWPNRTAACRLSRWSIDPLRFNLEISRSRSDSWIGIGIMFISGLRNSRNLLVSEI
jgi:putative restriction endonuclease